LGVLENDAPKEAKKMMNSNAVKVIERLGERTDVVMDLYF
jgi:hypothetical protein